jgi:Uma2 family endonuclease
MSTHAQTGLTVADLGSMPEDGNRYELVAGELYASRAPHIVHQAVISNVLHAFRDYLEQNPIGRVFPEVGVIFSEQDAVIPDLLFISNERFYQAISGGRLTSAPDLIVEVFSSGTENERRDRSVKRYLYGKYGVKEYWIVNWEVNTVEIYRPGSSGGLELQETLGMKDELTSPLLPGFHLTVEAVFLV